MFKNQKLLFILTFFFFYANCYSGEFIDLSYKLNSKIQDINALERIKKEQENLYTTTKNPKYPLYANFIEFLILNNNQENIYLSTKKLLEIEFSSKLIDKELHFLCVYNLGTLLEKKHPKLSIDYFYKTLKLSQELNIPNLIPVCYKYLGDIQFNSFKNYEKAIFFYNKENSYLKENQYLQKSSYCNNLALCYERLNAIDKSIFYSEKAVRYFNKIPSVTPIFKDFVYDIKLNLSRYLSIKGRKIESERIFTEVIDYYLKSNDKKMVAVYLQIYKHYLRYNDKRYNDIILLLHKSMDNSNITDEEKLPILKELIDYYTVKKDSKKTNEFQGKYIFTIDALANNKNKKIFENEIKIVEKILTDIEKNDKEKALIYKENQIKKQKKILLIGLIVLVITVLVIVEIYKLYESVKAKNLIIENNIIELDQSKAQLNISLKEKELLLKEIHHRVKNNFQLVNSLLNIQIREDNEITAKEFNEKAQNRINAMSLLHENLYQTKNLDKIDFSEYVHNLVVIIKNTLLINKKIKCKVTCDNLFFDIQTSLPLGLIINELYSNAIKHAFPNKQEGEIIINVNEIENKKYQVVLSDNGIGIEEKDKNKKTLGLNLIHLLVDQLNGSISIDCKNGTRVTILFAEH